MASVDVTGGTMTTVVGLAAPEALLMPLTNTFDLDAGTGRKHHTLVLCFYNEFDRGCVVANLLPKPSCLARSPRPTESAMRDKLDCDWVGTGSFDITTSDEREGVITLAMQSVRSRVHQAALDRGLNQLKRYDEHTNTEHVLSSLAQWFVRGGGTEFLPQAKVLEFLGNLVRWKDLEASSLFCMKNVSRPAGRLLNPDIC